MNKFLKPLLALTVMSGFIAAMPQAANATTPFAIAGDNTNALNVTYSGGLTGTLKISIPNGFLRSKVGLGVNNNCTIVYTPMTGLGAANYTFNPGTGVFDLLLTGGSFRIIDNVTGAFLLGGQFTNVVLHGTNGSSSLALTMLKDGATYALPAPFFPAFLSPNGGSFSIEFVAKGPVGAGTAGMSSFSANDGMTFGAQP